MSELWYKVGDKILRHSLLFDFQHERPLIIDIQIMILIAPRTTKEKKNK